MESSRRFPQLTSWSGLERVVGRARTLRVEYPGAICHVMNRGGRQKPIFKVDLDRRLTPSPGTEISGFHLPLNTRAQIGPARREDTMCQALVEAVALDSRPLGHLAHPARNPEDNYRCGFDRGRPDE